MSTMPSIVMLIAIVAIALFCVAVFSALRGRKMLAAGLGLTFLIALLWVNREFHPWMASGRAVHISSSTFGQYDFQVWQLKNRSVTEPFTTGLFVLKQNGQWRVFILDFEDTYRPSVTLQQDASGVAVYEDGEKLGTFDFNREILTRGSDGTAFEATTVTTEPPGDWSIRN